MGGWGGDVSWVCLGRWALVRELVGRRSDEGIGSQCRKDQIDIGSDGSPQY